MIAIAKSIRRQTALLMLAALAGLAAAPAAAQIETIDPDAAIDADLAGPGAGSAAPAAQEAGAPSASGSGELPATTAGPADSVPASKSDVPVESAGYAGPGYADQAATAATTPPAQASSTTYHEDDLIGAAEGVFGKGAEGLAGIIEDLLSKQGEPNAYIVGREGGGAFIFGVRYGSGTLYHKVEGQKPVYWTGPSVGFDAGANAGSTFVLVYNLWDSEELYERFPAGEGQAYLVGGFTASYMRKGDVVLIPIRAGAGLRLGVNAGYMKFSKKQRWLPF